MTLSEPENVPILTPRGAEGSACANGGEDVAEGVAVPQTEGLTHLFWLAGGRWVPVPGWARFIIEVGARAASFHSGEARLVAALALPTRAFAAAFAAAGAVVASFERIP